MPETSAISADVVREHGLSDSEYQKILDLLGRGGHVDTRDTHARVDFTVKVPRNIRFIGATVNGQVGPGGVDRCRFQALKGQHLVVACSARELIPYISDAVPGWFQATVALYDAKGKEVGYADDYRFHPDPVLYYEIPADGEYALEIKDSIYRGREDFVYRITIGELPYLTGVFPLGAKLGDKGGVDMAGTIIVEPLPSRGQEARAWLPPSRRSASPIIFRR